MNGGPNANTEPKGAALRRLGVTGEPLLYLLFSAALTLWIACLFYSSIRLQTTYTGHLPLAKPAEWSAPLDDVFIHFDFARATARGYPFQWSEGNGYSSGGTSLLYPFVLALGYWGGLRQLQLMVWAGIVACVSVLAFLLACRRLFRDLPRWTSYLVPPAILGIGVMNWSLFSGMEVAFFLALWGGALVSFDDLVRGPPGLPPPQRLALPSLLLGFWGALLVATRPEAALPLAVLGLAAAASVRREHGGRRALGVLLAAGAPAAAVLIAHAVANRLLTGDSTAAGALVKLELHHPHLSRAQVWDAWWFHVRYQFMRVFDYHLSAVRGIGFFPVAFALFALLPRATRRPATLLLASAVSWTLIVALNGQVRWQNERYTMPALAWVMLAAALGAGALLGRPFALGKRGLRLRWASALVTIAAIAAFAWFQRPKFRDQLWFFGRASRNIRDQHVRVARLLRLLEPPPRRVLVGDAGAIPYVSDLPSLDIIGLGGYGQLPFARATRQGVGAALELLERMPADQRPDVMAIYPSWWGTLPLWFGDVIAEVPVEGNVICGGRTKVVYRPKWNTFEGSGVPFSLDGGLRVADAIDLADVVSERQRDFDLEGAVGYVDMKLLPHPTLGARDVWDAGRLLPAGARARFTLHAAQGRAARVVLRTAPSQPVALRVELNGEQLTTLELAASEGWHEVALPVPADRVRNDNVVVVSPTRGELLVFHAFLLQAE